MQMESISYYTKPSDFVPAFESFYQLYYPNDSLSDVAETRLVFVEVPVYGESGAEVGEAKFMVAILPRNCTDCDSADTTTFLIDSLYRVYLVMFDSTGSPSMGVWGNVANARGFDVRDAVNMSTFGGLEGPIVGGTYSLMGAMGTVKDGTAGENSIGLTFSVPVFESTGSPPASGGNTQESPPSSDDLGSKMVNLTLLMLCFCFYFGLSA